MVWFALYAHLRAGGLRVAVNRDRVAAAERVDAIVEPYCESSCAIPGPSIPSPETLTEPNARPSRSLFGQLRAVQVLQDAVRLARARPAVRARQGHPDGPQPTRPRSARLQLAERLARLGWDAGAVDILGLPANLQ